ncbi:hypothetical protein [Methylobacterium radiodurans]|uniref:SMP-30/Gluconolactonase/LRE-like region domain-containing protein n=1 Tax=Methylobacterium radiodurans TaxID=2202828 RepID=A0A2U8VTW8_9HYPH|nr:hypothetical protein [Methylobacterium radiodurans]AWN36546.1 hypothetical protein DK427_13065 [Methylobacterium radiodurans]
MMRNVLPRAALRLLLACGTLALSDPGSAAGPDEIALPASGRHPENVAADAKGNLYVSSITEGGVLRVDAGSGAVTPFLAPGSHGTRSTFGVLVDEPSGTLWVASNDASMLRIPGPSGTEGAWVKALDLRTGALKSSVRLPDPRSIANDFALGSDGALYVTNTASPQILRLKPGAAEFEIFAEDPALKGGLDGIAFGTDGDLYVNTFMTGELFRVAVEGGRAGRITKLATSRPLKFPDGLKPHRTGFLMVEGAGPLSRVTIRGEEAVIEDVRRFDGPSGLTIVGDRVWVSEGRIGAIGAGDSGQAAGSKLRSLRLD